MPTKDDILTIGEVAARSGHATSAVRFYEAQGLISVASRSSARRSASG
jgi:MerR family redox-sensitive transcriptional activator SoxR